MSEEEKLKKLLELAKSSGKVIYSPTEKDGSVDRFIIDNKISSGIIVYDKHLIYLLYIMWCNKKNLKCLSKPFFCKKFGKKFKSPNVYYFRLEKLEIPIELIKRYVINLIFKQAKEKNEKETKSLKFEPPNASKT